MNTPPHHPEKIWAVVAAAGVGRRMAAARPKQYLLLGGRRVLDHALAALCECPAVEGVVVGIRAADSWWRAAPFRHARLVAVTEGGERRVDTVLAGVRHLLERGVAAPSDWVMVHDGARPCVGAADLDNLITAARAHGAGAILGVPLTDALKRVNGDGGVVEAMERADCWRAMTPQMFRCGALAAALQRAVASGAAADDECAAMAAAGVGAVVVAGHPANIKITVPADLDLAARYLGVAGCAGTPSEAGA